MSVFETASLSGKVITVLGGTGFLGRHLAQELLARGARLRLASRTPEKAWRARPLGNLGQLQLIKADVTKPASLANAVAGSDIIINLVGGFKGDLDALQGAGAGAIAAAAKAAGAESFIHVSALGADATSAVNYARTKGEGEAAVLSAFPTATILRPSIMFAEDDNFVMMFAKLINKFAILPVFAPQTKIQPLFVDDAAEAIANALSLQGAEGRTFELAGPEVMTVLQLNERIAATQYRKPSFIELPDGVSSIIAALPLAPISRDQFALLKAGNVANSDVPSIAELGVNLRPLSLFLDRWMVQFRKSGRFSTGATQPS